MADDVVHVSLPSGSPPPTLELETNAVDNWKLWKQMWENYLIVSGLESKPDKYKCALLLHTIGREALRVYNGFDMTVAQRQTPSEIIKKFDEHIPGGTKEFFERYKFNMCYQKSEPFEQYYSTLRRLVVSVTVCVIN